MEETNMIILEIDKIFGIKIFDEDFYKLVSLFGLNLLITFLIGRLIYYPFNGKKREFLFAYLLISSVIFFLCFALKAFKVDTGLAIGLFALLGIIRFRTDPIPIKEMSYLFIFIGLSMINAFTKKMSVYEIVFINSIAIAILLFMEMFLHKRKVEKQFASMDMVYGNLENTKPQNYEALVTDITNQTGFTIDRIKVGKINLKTREVDLKVYYKK